MEMKTIVRLGAIAFVALTLGVTMIMVDEPEASEYETLSVAHISADTDLLSRELKRCQLIGAAGAQDSGCLHAWSEQRNRFFLVVIKKHREPLDAGTPASAANTLAGETQAAPDVPGGGTELDSVSIALPPLTAPKPNPEDMPLTPVLQAPRPAPADQTTSQRVKGN